MLHACEYPAHIAHKFLVRGDPFAGNEHYISASPHFAEPVFRVEVVFKEQPRKVRRERRRYIVEVQLNELVCDRINDLSLAL